MFKITDTSRPKKWASSEDYNNLSNLITGTLIENIRDTYNQEIKYNNIKHNKCYHIPMVYISKTKHNPYMHRIPLCGIMINAYKFINTRKRDYILIYDDTFNKFSIGMKYAIIWHEIGHLLISEDMSDNALLDQINNTNFSYNNNTNNDIEIRCDIMAIENGYGKELYIILSDYKHALQDMYLNEIWTLELMHEDHQKIAKTIQTMKHLVSLIDKRLENIRDITPLALKSK